MWKYVYSISFYLAALVASVAGAVAWYQNGPAPVLAAPVAIVAASLVLLMVQRAFAFRDDWRNWRGAFGVDLLHFTLSSGAVALILELTLITVAWLFASWVESSLQTSLWPDAWPVAIQLIAAILLADLGSYWVHRWAHEAKWFWKFHSVHHSSERMYVFASGRNHPLNVTFTYLGHTLPLALLGAEPVVLLGVAVFTAVHGMLQHANIDLRLGVFNYVFAGPELHRMHHSVREDEAHANYGSNLAWWDLVFGTLRIPDEAQRKRAVGLPFLTVRTNFFTQLLAPFRYQRHLRAEVDENDPGDQIVDGQSGEAAPA